MKKHFYLITLIACSLISNAQTWTNLNTGSASNLRSVHFPSSAIGYAVGDLGTILKTSNGGTTWQSMTTNFPGYWFWDVHFLNADTGFVVGESDPGFNPNGSGIVIKTIDGGLNWITCIPAAPYPFRDLFVLNNDTIFACGGAEQTDGKILKSVDGGYTWTQIGLTYFDAMLGGMYFMNSNVGCLGVYESVFGTYNPTNSSWLNTTNGSSFTNVISSPMGYWNFSTDFPVLSTGYMMRSTYVGTDPVYIRKTVNAGTSWTESPINGFTGSTYGLDFYAADTGYVVGAGGVILKTSNGGGSWVPEVSGTTQDLRSVYFVNGTTGYVAGTNGTILKYTSCPATGSTLTQTSCTSLVINGQTYSSSGTFTQTLVNSAGCDSILTLNLNINTLNNGMTQNGTLLTANATGASYQWLNCPSYTPIVGATNQSYTALANGDYAVKVTIGNCTDTSACNTVSGVGIKEFDLSHDMKLYPNSSTDILHIEFEKEIKSLYIQITALSDQVLYSVIKDHSKHITVPVSNLSKGLYFITLSDGEYKMTRKFIKE